MGVFDSGVGGLSVLRAIRACLPYEALIYYADSFYAPYGLRDDAFINARSTAIAEWLIAQGAKAIVVACNTATAQTIEHLRAILEVPVIGVEPGLKPAAEASRSRQVGVLATAATLRSRRFEQLLARFASQCQFHCTAGLGLVEAIEAGEPNGRAVEALLRAYLEPMLAAGVDTLVLGCTHYPFARETIERVSAGQLTIIDTGEAIARQLAHRLDECAATAAPRGSAVAPRLLSSSDGRQLSAIASSLLGETLHATHQTIPFVAPASEASAGPSAT